MTDTASTRVTRNDERNRYEIHVDDTLGGFTEFFHRRDTLVFFHTEVDPAFKGRGLGSILVGEAMADVARRGHTVSPVCPFVQRYLRDHDVPGLTVSAATGDDRRAGTSEPPS